MSKGRGQEAREPLVVREPVDPATLPAASRHRVAHRLFTLADGAPLDLPVTVVRGARPGPHVLAVAGVHGDEFDGVAGLQDAVAALDPAEVAGTFVALHSAHPPAFRAARRTSPLDDLDLNRTFPGASDGTPSQRLAHRLLEGYVRPAAFVLSMHSWSTGGLVVPYVEFPGGDGEAARRALAAARSLGLEFLRTSAWHPGLLVANAVALGIPAVEVEIGGLGVSHEANVRRYAGVVTRCLRHLGVLPGGAAPTPGARVVRHLEVGAPAGGLLRRLKEPGEPVRRGETFATVRDLWGRTVADVTSPVDGVLAACRLRPSVNPGDRVATLFEDAGDRS